MSTSAQRRGSSLAAAALVTLLLAGPASAVDWNLASPFTEGSHQVRNLRLFAQDVDKATEGRVKITVHAGASLFKLPEVKRAVQTGQVAIGEVLHGTMSNEDPIHGVSMLPFAVQNLDQAKVLWETQRPYVAARFDKQGMTLLQGVIWPGQSVFTRKEVKSLADMKGMKFRVQDPNTARLAQLMGVVPVRVETADVPQAFLTGIIEGMFTSNATAADLKAWDYIKYTYEVNAWYPLNVTFANKDMLAKLEERDRNAIMAAAKASEARGWGMEAEETKNKTAMLKEKGVQVLAPPEALLKEFREAGAKMLAEWKEKAGADGQKLFADFDQKKPK